MPESAPTNRKKVEQNYKVKNPRNATDIHEKIISTYKMNHVICTASGLLPLLMFRRVTYMESKTVGCGFLVVTCSPDVPNIIWDYFETTPVMSTYLVATVIGEYSRVETSDPRFTKKIHAGSDLNIILNVLIHDPQSGFDRPFFFNQENCSNLHSI